MENTDTLLTDSPGKILDYLYAANYPWLEKYVLQNSGSRADAQDIFQESVSAAWINLKQRRFTGDNGQLNAYVRQICKYKWLNYLKSAPRNKLSFGNDMEAIGLTDQTAEILEIQMEESRLLRHCFDRLGNKCREVLRLFYYERRPLTRIASEMKNTEESIKTIKYRCMMQLRKLFMELNSKNEQV